MYLTQADPFGATMNNAHLLLLSRAASMSATPLTPGGNAWVPQEVQVSAAVAFVQ
jgi:hypothetical protein